MTATGARDGSSRSGWCMEGRHNGCRFGGCSCHCHGREVTCDGCENVDESGWGDTPLCLDCEDPANVCAEHLRTFVGTCPLD